MFVLCCFNEGGWGGQMQLETEGMDRSVFFPPPSSWTTRNPNPNTHLLRFVLLHQLLGRARLEPPWVHGVPVVLLVLHLAARELHVAGVDHLPDE